MGLPGASPYVETDETITEPDGVPRDWEPPVPGSEAESLHQDMLRASCAFFAATMLSGPPEEPYHGRFMINEHHEEWSDLVNTHPRLCVNAPRDHGKSFFFNLAYPLWKAWKNPGRKGFIFSATQQQAERILQDIKVEVETNPKLAHLLPENMAKAKWSQREARLRNGFTFYARGFGTRIRGAHPIFVVCDDVLNDETAYSETTRNKQVDYFRSAVTNMVVPGGQIIVIGTPFHSLDLYAKLADNPVYRFRRYQAIKRDEVSGKEFALWPERYSMEKLKERSLEIGSVQFTREFLCLPIADDMSIFPTYLFQGKPKEQPTLKLGMPLEFWKKSGITPYMGVDFAISSNVSADYTVIWVMGIDGNGVRWIIDIFRDHGMSYEAQKSKIIEYGMRYDPAMIYLESNQMQRIWGDQLIRETDLPIKKFITMAREKHALDKGLPSLRVLLENNKFRIPRGDKNSVALTDVWIDEMRAHTWTNGKLQSIGAHDDTAMACWICDQAIRQGGFSFSFGEDGDGKKTLDEMLAEQNKDPEPGTKIERPDELQLGPSIANGRDEDERTSAVLVDDDVEDWRPKQGAPVPGAGWRF